MYQFQDLEDTIAAIATAVGQGGIGIVRLSGKKALAIADQMFMARNKKKPSEFKNYTIHYGWVVRKSPLKRKSSEDGFDIIDEALLTVMRAPQSYTKEDVVEFSSHGGTVCLKAILALATELGARLAEPGEFTKRAFLNGRIDLTQAEAVLDIINAKTDAFLKVSTHQLKGELSSELESIRESLMAVYTQLEAVVNFPEDDIDAAGKKELANKIRSAQNRIERLFKSGEHGRILKEGIKIVICGRPNVGKSSLLNVLLKVPRAIVTDIAGTTRDTIEETAQIKGIPFHLVDTAGILEPRDLIEQEAVKRSRMSIESADLVLLVLDSSRPLSREDEDLIEKIREKNFLVVINKCDLSGHLDEERIKNIFPSAKIVKVSAIKKIAIDGLESAIVDNVLSGLTPDTHGVLVSNIRHINSLQECLMTVQKALVALKNGLSPEFISEDIKSAVNSLDCITGRNIDQDLLDKIFSEFCIGK